MLRNSQDDIEKNSQPTEKTQLIAKNNDKQCTLGKVASTGSEIALGVLGLGAGILYLGPAQQCAEMESCGKWLGDLVNQGFAIGVFTAGGADFSLINAYMSSKSIQTFIEYIKKQNSTGAKIGKGTVIIAYAVTQNASLLLASLGTSTAAWQTILTVSGGAPGSLFGAVGMIDHEFPVAISALKKMGRHMREYLVNCCFVVDAPTRSYFARMRHYEAMQQQFLAQLTARGNHLASIASSLEVDGTPNPLAYLFSQPFALQPKSRLASGMGLFGNAAGFGVASVFTAGFTMNTFHMLERYISILPLRIASTAFLSSASIYGNLKVTMHGISSFMEALGNVLRGRPIESSIFQLRPKTTVAVVGFAMLASALSFAVADIIYENEFPDSTNRVRNGFRYAAIVGMDLYHLSGLFEFYKLAYSKLTRNEKERFIFLVEQEIERMKKMPLEAFIDYVEKNTHDMNQLLSLQPYDAEQDRVADIEAPREEAIIINDYDDEAEEIGCFTRIRRWFWSSNDDRDDAVNDTQESKLRFSSQ